MNKVRVAVWSEIEPGGLVHALVQSVDLVVVQWPDGEGHSVLYGRCVHRGALMADGHIDGDNLVCGIHAWDYRFDTGVSSYRDTDVLHKFTSVVEDGIVWVDGDEVAAWADSHPQPYVREAYQGEYQDPTGTHDEPYVKHIHALAEDGLSRVGHHGVTGAMGVPRDKLPKWDGLQILTAQLARPPLLDDHPVETAIIIGPAAESYAAVRSNDFTSI
jgi:nitrite reductase/ring-hydroxylating ferredoxin subunit